MNTAQRVATRIAPSLALPPDRVVLQPRTFLPLIDELKATLSMKLLHTLRLGTSLSLVALAGLISGCQMLMDGAKYASDEFGGSDSFKVRARVSPGSDIEAKREHRILNAVVRINDPELQTALEGLCIDLGFRPIASNLGVISGDKNQWFSNVVQEMKDRKELFTGADVVLAGYVPTFKSDRRGEGRKTDTVEIVVQAYSVGTSELCMITTAELKSREGIFQADDSTRLTQFTKICDKMKVELDEKGFSGAPSTPIEASADKAP